MEIPHEGPFSDFVWSDPDEDIEYWGMSPRGAGWRFGSKITDTFNHINGLDLIATGRFTFEGYKYWFDKKNCVTVTSVCNKSYRCGN